MFENQNEEELRETAFDALKKGGPKGHYTTSKQTMNKPIFENKMGSKKRSKTAFLITSIFFQDSNAKCARRFRISNKEKHRSSRQSYTQT